MIWNVTLSDEELSKTNYPEDEARMKLWDHIHSSKQVQEVKSDIQYDGVVNP